MTTQSKLRSISLVGAFLLLSACQPDPELVQSPTAKDVEGRWESLNIGNFVPYVLLEIDSDGDGIFIGAGPKGASVMGTVDSFEPTAEGFEMTAYSSLFGKETRQPVQGRLTSNGLCLYLPEMEQRKDPKLPICFTRASSVEQLRRNAEEALVGRRR